MISKRVCLSPLSREYDSEDRRLYKISVDLVLDEAGIPSPKMTAFGLRGGLAENSPIVQPFILFKDGSVDFGDEWDSEYREATFNLRGQGRKVVEGEVFTLCTPDEGEITYSVTQIIPLC